MATTNTLQNIKYIAICLTVIFVGVFFYWYFPKPIKDKDGLAIPDLYSFQTGDIYKGKYEKLLDSVKGMKATKPIIIEHWLSPEFMKVDSVKIINEYLALHVPKQQEPIYIKSDFIIGYPDATKLLDLKLSLDTLSITTYDRDASIKTHIYPLYLESFDYGWHKNKLIHNNTKSVKENKAVTINKLKWNNLYVNGGYDVYMAVPMTGLEYNLSPGRFKLDLDASVLIMDQPKLNLNAKLGYRLFK